MKKLLVMAAALVCAFSVNAQINKGEVVATAGVGLGNSVYKAYDKALIPINLEAEYGLVEGLFGVDGLSLGVGASLSYTQGKQEYTIPGIPGYTEDATYGVKSASYIVGAKGYFHYDFFDLEKLDTYAAITLGWNIASAKTYGDYVEGMAAASAGGLYYGVSVGARYWFTDAIGANLEAGVGLSFLKAGVTFRF